MWRGENGDGRSPASKLSHQQPAVFAVSIKQLPLKSHRDRNSTINEIASAVRATVQKFLASGLKQVTGVAGQWERVVQHRGDGDVLIDRDSDGC